MDYVFTARQRTGDGFAPTPGPTRFLAVPPAAGDIARGHEIKRADWFKQVIEASRGGTTNPMTEGDVLIHVHGFNTPTASMLRRHRLIRAALEKLGFRGVVVSFDWPCADKALNYLEDRKDAKATALRLVDDGVAAFAAMQRPDCRIDVHVLAHSMGCYVVREAFDDADDRPAVAMRGWTVSQMMLIGADVSAASLSAGNPKGSSLYRRSIRVTNYYNPFDDVLSLSAVKRPGVSPRLGRVGMAAPLDAKAANVYCGEYYRGIRDRFTGEPAAGHTWYFDDPVLMQDVWLTISGQIDRHEYPTRAPTSAGNLALVPPR